MHDLHALDGLEVVAVTDEVLAALRKNRSAHAGIVKEARVGYLKRAAAAVAKRLAELKSGKIVALHFDLQLPMDQTAVYDTAIAALAMHTGGSITLTAMQVRQLIQDEWSWKQQFFGINSAYSSTALRNTRGKK